MERVRQRRKGRYRHPGDADGRGQRGPLSALILVRGDAAQPSGDTTGDTAGDTAPDTTGQPSSEKDGASPGLIAAVTGGATLVVAGAAVGITAAKRKKDGKNGKNDKK